MSGTYQAEVVAVRRLSVDDAVAEGVARGSSALHTRSALARALHADEALVECTLRIDPVGDTTWAPRPSLEVVLGLLAQRDDRRHEALFLALYPDLWELTFRARWEHAVLAYVFVERTPDRSVLVVTLPAHLLPGIDVGSTWGSAAYADPECSEFLLMPPAEGLASMRHLRTLEPLDEAESVIEISRVVFSPDDRLLATVDTTGTVKLYGVPEGQLLKTFGSKKAWRSPHVAFTPDGRHLAQGSSTGARNELCLWSLDGTDAAELLTPDANLHRLAFTPTGDKLVASALDRILVLEAPSLRRLAELSPVVDDPDDRSMGPLALNQAGDFGVAAGEVEAGAVLQGFRVEPPAEVWRTEPFGDVALAVAFTPDGNEIVTAHHGSIDVHDAATGERRRRLVDEPGGVTFTIAFGSSGDYLAAGNPDGLAIWRYRDGVEVRSERFSDVPTAVYAVAVSPGGRWLAAATPRDVVLFEIGAAPP